jgi:transglutaminase-like putative cysteine protease
MNVFLHRKYIIDIKYNGLSKMMKLFTRPYQKRWWDIPAALLLFAALTTTVLRLIVTDWTKNLDIIESLIVLSVISGFALGYSRFPSWLSTIFSFIFGFFFINWQLTSLTTITPGLPLLDRLIIIYGRLDNVIGQLVKKELVTDSILFILLMSILLWIVGFTSSYLLVRKANAWLSIIPAGIIILFIQYFDPLVKSRIWFLGTFIFFCLLLIARTTFLHNRDRWLENRTNLPPELGFDFIRLSFYLTSVIVIFSLWIPGISSSLPGIHGIVDPIKREWNELSESMENAFASLKATIGVSSDYYGTTLKIGRGNSLSSEVMFQGTIRGNLPKGVRLYWKARTYDYYDGQQWQSLSNQAILWNPDNTELILPPMKERWETEFTVTSSTFYKTMIAPAQALWINRRGEVDVFKDPDNTTDIISFRSLLSIRPGITYFGQSALNQATIFDMRHAKVDYPNWIKQRYLQLPDSITPRTRQLAEDITKGLSNPYDKVNAIIQFMRNTYKYVDVVPEAPENQDIVDWFLFDQREGFCNYYASSVVVMLRSLGIPSRLSAGYATGQDLKDGNYLILQKDAHAWPEVYFPELGWVEFEPTASIASIVRLPGEDPNLNSSNSDNETNRPLPPTPMMDVGDLLPPLDNSLKPKLILTTGQIILITFFFFISAGFIIWLLLRRNKNLVIPSFPEIIENFYKKIGVQPPESIRRWIEFNSLPAVIRYYHEINQALFRLKIIPSLNSTPSERASQLIKNIPEAEQPAAVLIQEYQVATYSLGSPNVSVAEKASKRIRKLSFSETFNLMIKRMKNIRIRPRKKRINYL